jgi:hypothetical protein
MIRALVIANDFDMRKVKWSIAQISLETHNGDPDSIIAL